MGRSIKKGPYVDANLDGKIVAINTPNTLIDNLVATGFEKEKEVKKANLEDVFINLTGKEWRAD